MAENDTDTAAVDDATLEAEFGSGFAGVTVTTDKSEARGQHKPFVDLTKPPANGKAEPERDAAKAEAEPPPEVVQVTAKEWAEVRAAAAKTASYDQQIAKQWGTIGTLQKTIKGLTEQQVQSASPQPTARKFEVSKRAYAKMETDFPELAQMSREALGEALSELDIPAKELDDSRIEGIVTKIAAKREVEALEDAYPEWRTIVGAVDVTKEQPDAENPFRKWLATKDAEYQDRVNGSETAAVISRAIRLFQRETAPVSAKPNGAPRDTARADRIRAAVQPRGDNAGVPAGKSDDDEFVAGFNSR